MLTLISGITRIEAKSANKLFARAKAAGVDFTDYDVYADGLLKTIVASVRLRAGCTGYGSRNGSSVWQATFADTIQNVRLFVETHRLRNNGKIPTTLTPLLVMPNA